MSTRRKAEKQTWALLIMPLLIVAHLSASTMDDAIVLKKQGMQWELNIQKGPLRVLLERLAHEHQVIISGLESRENELLNLTTVGDSIADIIRSLLLHLGEKNFAFEYTDNRLSRVLVLAGGAEDMRNISAIVSSPMPASAESVDAVEVLAIVEGSQAQKLDIRKGDLVLEYDGLKINRASELVAETQKRSTDDEIELVLLRNGDPVRLNARGGFLGVQVKTVKIFTEELVDVHERF